MFNSSGIISYSPEKLGDNPQNWWIVLRCDPEIGKYYRYLSQKYNFVKLNRPAWREHITISRNEEPIDKNKIFWRKYEGLEISFDYSHIIASFTINFEPNQNTFSADQYGAEFARAMKAASTFPNAVIVVRGHSDPTQTLVDFLNAGQKSGVIKRSGQKGSYTYYINGKALDVSQTNAIVSMIKNGNFDTDPNPKDTMQAALGLSLARSEAVRKAIVETSAKQGIKLDPSQIQSVGAGIIEPLIAKPSNMNEAKQNMRVEFRIVKIPAEAIKSSDFDF